MELTCAQCGVTAERLGGIAIYCVGCAIAGRPRIAAPGRVSNVDVKARRSPDGKTVCRDCATPVEHVVCGKRRRPQLRCSPCAAKHRNFLKANQTPAAAAVARAVSDGRLKRPGDLACADCGKPAHCYDHRDYTKPLLVEPVCRSCNSIRGHANVWTLPVPEAKPQEA